MLKLVRHLLSQAKSARYQVTSGLLMALTLLGGWRSTIQECGGQSVMMNLESLKLLWPVDNWALVATSRSAMLTLEGMSNAILHSVYIVGKTIIGM